MEDVTESITPGEGEGPDSPPLELLTSMAKPEGDIEDADEGKTKSVKLN